MGAEIAPSWSNIASRSFTAQRSTMVERLGALGPDLDPTEAADFVYLLMSPDTHRILTVERGWTPEQYEAWLARALRRTLLAQ